MPSNRSDPALIQACRRGEQNAWSELVAQYGRLVFSIPRRYGFSEADCEDIMQAAFASLVRSLASLNDETRLSAWLITTTHRECWRVRKLAAREETAEILLKHAEAPPTEDILRWERQHLVRQALAQLGGTCEQLLTALFRTTGHTDYQQIARELGMKVGSIGPTRARCFARLATILRELGFDEHSKAGTATPGPPAAQSGSNPKARDPSYEH